MKRGLRIVSMFLTVVYLLSMLHTLFHHQMHEMLAHAEQLEYSACDDSCHEHICHQHHNHNCCDCLDHKHNAPAEEGCNADLQFLPSNSSRDLIYVKTIDLVCALLSVLDSDGDDLSMELYHLFDSRSSLYRSVEILSHRPLRAPPIS